MFRISRTSRPLTALAALMALSVGGCGGSNEPIELTFGDRSFFLDETIGQADLREGESVTNLTQKRSSPFRILAGGAAYRITLEGGLVETVIYDDVHPGAYDGRSSYSAIYRDDRNDIVNLDFALSIGNGTQYHFLELFALENLDAEQSAPFASYTDNSGNRNAKLSIVEPGEAILGLEYATFGSWSQVPANGIFEGGFFFSGVPTKDAGMPNSGAATYAGLTIGTLLDATTKTRSSLEGDMELTVNFADGSVDGNFTNMMQTAEDGTVTSWRSFSMAANINAGTDNFTGTTITNDLMLEGQAEGAFFGPNAAEVAGVWTLSGAGETALGSFGGGKD